MDKLKKLSAGSIVRQALNWGANNVEAMIDAYRAPDGSLPRGGPDGEHIAYLVHLHNSMVAYRKRRFGWTYDPMKGAYKIDARTKEPLPTPPRDDAE